MREPDELSDAPDAAEAARALKYEYEVPTEQIRIGGAREGIAEVMIAPRSTLIGREVCAGMRTQRDHLVILAVRRDGEDGLRGDASGRSICGRATPCSCKAPGTRSSTM